MSSKTTTPIITGVVIVLSLLLTGCGTNQIPTTTHTPKPTKTSTTSTPIPTNGTKASKEFLKWKDSGKTYTLTPTNQTITLPSGKKFTCSEQNGQKASTVQVRLPYGAKDGSAVYIPECLYAIPATGALQGAINSQKGK